MRAKIAGLIVLTGIVALTTSFVPGSGEHQTPAAPRLLTEEEADCLVGGSAGCIDEGMYTWVECMINEGVDVSSGESIFTNIDTVGACGFVGVLDAAWCGITSFFDWIF